MDDRSRRGRSGDDDESYPNPVGGFAGLLFPWRRAVFLVAVPLAAVLIVISVLT